MDFEYLGKWVKREYGIDFTGYKTKQLHRRIGSFIDRVGVKNTKDFVNVLNADSKVKQKFLDFITINVTEFFRNPDIFQQFENHLKEYIEEHPYKINIWSAACSNGAEPYSIAMIVKSMGPHAQCRILATDIDDTILQYAKDGIYNKSETKNIKSDFMYKYFSKVDDTYKVTQDIKNMVTFKKHDLINDRYERNLDVIVSRNVIIYFNEEAKEKIYTKFSEALKKGGILFVGATESIYNYNKYGFERFSTFIYKKI